MREVFQDQLHEVQDRLVEMAESVTVIMKDASSAFINSDVAAADRAIAAGKKCRTISRIFPPKAGQQIIVPVKYQKVRQFAHPCAILLCVSVSTRVSLLTSKARSCPIGQDLSRDSTGWQPPS